MSRDKNVFSKKRAFWMNLQEIPTLSWSESKALDRDTPRDDFLPFGF